MNLVTYEELSARNALREHGKGMRGTSAAETVLEKDVSLMEEVEVSIQKTPLVCIIIQTLHFSTHLIKTRTPNTGLDPKCPVKPLYSLVYRQSELKTKILNLILLFISKNEQHQEQFRPSSN